MLYTVVYLQTVDTTLVPVTWDEETYQARPKIGYFTEDGLMQVLY